MNDDHVVAELSTYIDGEARDPARIARHLQLCESCARHHMQLLKLSTHLHALPLPEPRPEFLTRVMAHVAEEKAPSARHWIPFPLRAPAWAMSLALLLIIAGFIAAWIYPPKPVATPTQQVARESLEQDMIFPDPSPLEDIGSYSGNEEGTVSYEDLISLLAEASSEDMDTESFYGDSDGTEQMETLDPQEAQALQELLTDYLKQPHTPKNEG